MGASDKNYVHIILLSLAITIAIFAVGILINYGLDFVRINTIVDQMVTNEIGTLAFSVQEDFTTSFDVNACQLLNSRVIELKKQIRQVGGDLGSYSSLSWFKKKDFDYLKRKYILLQLRFFTLIQQLNEECDNPYIPILFFYEIDHDESERQGFMLEDLSRNFEDQVVVLSIDKDYEDEPLIKVFSQQYNVTEAPTVIIGGNRTEGLSYGGQLNASVLKILRRPDPYSPVDFTYVLTSAGVNQTKFVSSLEDELQDTMSAFGYADLSLVIGRIKQNETVICSALVAYDQVKPSTTEEEALLAETSAALGCGRNRKAFLKKAAALWNETGLEWRAKILTNIADLKKPDLQIEPALIEPNVIVPSHATKLIIGESQFDVLPGMRIGTQVDRVTRDWLGQQIMQGPYGDTILNTFSEKHILDEDELRSDIGWHEGGRLKQLETQLFVQPVIAAGTMVVEKEGKWYAPDENGVFRFEVPLDKVSYPTTRFLRKDIAVIIDTHGVNMLVEQSIRNNVDVVLSDCDHPGKTAAAAYLSNKGIPVICLPDKFAFHAAGHDIDLYPSPPITFTDASAIVGGRPITIEKGETIITSNATNNPYALWYYQTPTSYFETITSVFPLRLITVQLDDFNQAERLTEKAEEHGADIIAGRVFSKHDYETFKKWLDKDKDNTVVLFHTTQYPYGYLLFNEYPEQTTFGDVNPRFE